MRNSTLYEFISVYFPCCEDLSKCILKISIGEIKKEDGLWRRGREIKQMPAFWGVREAKGQQAENTTWYLGVGLRGGFEHTLAVWKRAQWCTFWHKAIRLDLKLCNPLCCGEGLRFAEVTGYPNLIYLKEQVNLLQIRCSLGNIGQLLQMMK